MEDRVFIEENGREFEQEDGNLVGDTAGLADDRVIDELFRMTPFGSVASKGVIGYGIADASAVKHLVQAGAGTREILVYPHRALIGSRTLVADDAKANWRDIRSLVSVGTTTLAQSKTVTANISGNPRWDLLYETVTVDAEVGDSRFRKDPDTEVVAVSTVPKLKRCTSTLTVLAGTPAGSPAFPSLPADADPAYNIPLAYIRVLNAATAFDHNDIFTVAPALVPAPAPGLLSLRPANQMNKVGGSLLTRIPWAASSNRPGPYIPPTFVGGEMLVFGLQLQTALTKSIQTGDVIDDSRDWRGRIFRVTAYVNATAGRLLSFDPRTSAGDAAVPSYNTADEVGSHVYVGFGNSQDLQGETDYLIAFLANATVTAVTASGSPFIKLRVDHTTGALKIEISGDPNVNGFFWIEATPQFPNL